MPRLQSLMASYKNEKRTSRLMPYNPVADELSEELRGTAAPGQGPFISQTIQEMERERIKYFIKEYILARLNKINNDLFLSENNMSWREREYYKRYLKLVSDQGIRGEKQGVSSEYVGFYCTRRLEGIKIDTDIVKMDEGDFFVARLEDIVHFVDSGHLILM